jgi:CRP/FNR family transcriptional regulator
MRDASSKITKPYLLQSGWVLTELPANELAILEKAGQLHSGKRGDQLFKAGGYPKGVYWLTSGKVKIYQEGSGGQKRTNYIYSDNDLIGFRQLIANEPHPVSATFLEDTQYIMIPGDTFRQMLASSPVFARNILTALAREFTVWMNRMTVYTTYSVRDRVILALLILSEQYHASGSPKGVITMTRTDLSEYVGATLETVVRVLNKLKAEKMVSIEGRRISIANVSALAEMVSRK